MYRVTSATLQMNIIKEECFIKSMTFLCRKFCSFSRFINKNRNLDNIEYDCIQDSDFKNYQNTGTIWRSPNSH